MAMTTEAFNRMMGITPTPKVLANGKPVLQLYFNSLCGLNEYDKIMRFDCDSEIEGSITDFLNAIGFLSDDNGYKYLKYIFFSCTKRLCTPSKIGILYSECGKTFGVSENCVDMSILKSVLSAANSGKLTKINDIFRIDLFSDGERPTNSEFIMSVCNRLIYYKKYGIKLPYRA